MAEEISTESIEQRLANELKLLLSLAPDSNLTPDTTLQSLGLDSLRFVSLLITIEKVFGVSLMKSGLKRESLKTIRSLAQAIQSARH